MTHNTATLIYRYNVITIKIPNCIFFAEIKELVLRVIWNYKGLQRAETILKMKNETGVLISPDSQSYYKGKVIKTMWYWQ